MTPLVRLAAPGVVCLIGLLAWGAPPATAPARLRVLFIGNSLTASNDLPAVVQAVARELAIELQYQACAPGGVNLEDHWNDGHCRQLLDEGAWDFVVLQQGPSSRDDSRADLLKWSARWADAIRARGARPALYMVWPQQGQANGFTRVGDSYRGAADAAHARLLPAGDAWRAALAIDPDVTLYGHDGLHPTAEGSYLAALVIARQLTGMPIENVPERLTLSSGEVITVAPRHARTLRRAAAHVTSPQTKTP